MTSTAVMTARREAASLDPLRLAAIDLGSNSVHMIIAQADSDGAITTLWRMKEMVGLGRLSFPSKRLSLEPMSRATTALARFQRAAKQRQVEKIITVATSAVREARNGGDFIEQIKRKVGMSIRVISAREEARLIYLAVRHAVQLREKPDLIIDIGGGSVEFIVANDKQAMLLESRKLGAARMTSQFVHADPLRDVDKKKLLDHYQANLGTLCETIASHKPVRAFGTSGTLEAIATMCAGETRSSRNAEPLSIDRAPFEALLARLLPSSSQDRGRMPGLDDTRRDQIIAGALLVKELFDRLNLQQIRICGSALREGILLDYLERHVPEIKIRREVPDPRRRSVIDLARRCDWHKSHSQQVARLTLNFFDQLKRQHLLGADERELIEYGALLHDIGWHIGRKGHHKHSMYLVLHGNLSGFSPEEISVIANIARYHRKSEPKKTHASYTQLSSWGKRVVDVGAAMLRVADGLDRSHASAIWSISCAVAKQRIQCTLTARSDAELELWAARRKAGLFEKVFGRDLRFALVRR